jgi:hypothetical protein
VRNTYGELKDTTLKTWAGWFPDGSDIGYWREGEKTFYLEFDDVRAEIMFRALDKPADVAKVLSMELTGAWLNECREIPQEIVEGIQGRLERYPSQEAGGSNYWMMIADTNPPAIGTYWWKIFEHVPLEDNDLDTVVDCDSFHQPSGVSPEAENLPNLSPGYYTKKVKGRSRAWIDVYIHAKYAVSQEGKPVYHDTFNRDRHVSKRPLPINQVLPIVVGHDWGLTPAGLWMQMQEDGRIYVLRETPAFDMGLKRYIKTKFLPMQKTVFPDNPIIVIGDPSGVRRADSDESTCFKTFREFEITAKPASTNDPLVRIKVFDDLFSEYPDCQPRIMIDPSCKNFIAACQMLYRYPRKKLSAGEEFGDKPEKNDSSHLMEAGQYGAMFLTGKKYDPSEFTVYDNYDPLQLRSASPYRPALSVGY